MLGQEDRRVLAELEHRLRRDDPAFVARMLGEPPRRPVPLPSVLAAALVLVGGLVLVALGWWVAATLTAVWAMVIACALAHRRPPTDQAGFTARW